jgi:NDP-sugar pyrophosphorylase family protein
LRHTGIASPIAFDVERRRIRDIAGRLVGLPGTVDFANVSIWNPSVLRSIDEVRKISMANVLLNWMRSGGLVGGLILDDQKWFNVGSRADYFSVHRRIQELNWVPAYLTTGWPMIVSAGAVVHESARLEGVSWIGPNCRVGARVTLQDCFVWSDSEVESASELQDLVVYRSKVAGPVPRGSNIGFDTSGSVVDETCSPFVRA